VNTTPYLIVDFGQFCAGQMVRVIFRQLLKAFCMHIEVLSLFPEYIKGPLGESILKRAIQKRLLVISHHDIRDFSTRRDRRVDDRPSGGGPGMVMSPEPVAKTIRSLKGSDAKVVYLSPQGMPLTASIAKELSHHEHLILLCGHYEGIDQRVLDSDVDLEISIGDYVLTNGCLAALVVIDALARFIPGVLGSEQASVQDSFEGGLLDCPHYTHEPDFEGRTIPEVLLSGDHERIRLWRRSQALKATITVRPDLLTNDFSQPCDDHPSLQQIIVETPHFDATIRWYMAMLGVSPKMYERKAAFVCGHTIVTFVEGGLTAALQHIVLSFVVSCEQFACALRYGRQKKASSIGEPKRIDDRVSAFFRDPDGRTMEVTTFMNN
jgi:tRNA (guanine37-N1)-methyltransferase